MAADLTPSDGSGTIGAREFGNEFAHGVPVGPSYVREPPAGAALSSQEVVVQLASGLGRPRGRETERRTRAFVAALAELGSFAEAASASRLHPGRVLRLLDEDPQFAALARQVLDDRGLRAAG